MIADKLIFNSMLPVGLVIGITALLLVLFIYYEVKRKSRFLMLRILCLIIVLISLAMIVLNPSYPIQKITEPALLLTSGFEKEMVDSILNQQDLKVIVAPDAVPYSSSKTLSTWHTLKEEAQNIHFVLGNGIPNHALNENPNINFQYIKGKNPEGIINLKETVFKVNEQSFIRGTYRSSGNNVTLKLAGPGGVEDSLDLKGKGLLPFKLAIKPLEVGKFVYQLHTKRAGKKSVEPLPVIIEPENKLKILILQSFPTFELRYLKNYLSSKGHALSVRYQVSKNNYSYEYANQEKQAINGLTSDLLNSIDLLIVTSESLEKLNESEQKIVEQSIKKGLGLLILVDKKPDTKINKMFPFKITESKTDTVTLSSEQWDDKISVSGTLLRVNPSPFIETIFSDADGKILAGYSPTSLGRIGFQLLNNTHRIALEGKSTEYANIWSPLIENVSRQKQEKFKIELVSPFPYYPNEPIHFKVIATEEAPELYYDKNRIPLKEDIEIENVWYGTIWTQKIGWYQLSTQDSSHLVFYVHAPNEWNSIRRESQIRENNLYMKKNKVRNSITEFQAIVSPLLLFILFILASGGLWLTAKL
jgi:hypothetical protein